MNINETITESTEVEEGLKNKMVAALLAGAVSFGGCLINTADAGALSPNQNVIVDYQALERAKKQPGGSMLEASNRAGLIGIVEKGLGIKMAQDANPNLYPDSFGAERKQLIYVINLATEGLRYHNPSYSPNKSMVAYYAKIYRGDLGVKELEETFKDIDSDMSNVLKRISLSGFSRPDLDAIIKWDKADQPAGGPAYPSRNPQAKSQTKSSDVQSTTASTNNTSTFMTASDAAIKQHEIKQNEIRSLNLINDYAREVLANKITQEVVNNSGEYGLGYWQDQIDSFTAEMLKIKDPSIQKQYKSTLDKLQASINLYKSYLNSPNYVKNKDTVERILDFKQENKDYFPVTSKTVEKYGKNGLDFLEKNYQKFVDDEGDVNVADGANQQNYERLIAQFKSDVSSYKSYLAKIDISSQPTAPNFKQDQSPTASQSPKLPLPKSLDTSIQGFDTKTTGKGTGITKNGDIYTGEWKDGFANGLGERTLVNKGYTGGMVKTGNKLNTEWKNGMPVDGAKVKVTRPDGTVFNGHIKSSSDTPWGYVIVK